MRAPPDAATVMAGAFRRPASSMRRVIFSPTTEPIEPAMKRESSTPSRTGWPSIVPVPTTAASRIFVLL